MGLRCFQEEEETEPMSPKSRRPKPFHQFTIPKWRTQICSKAAVIDTSGASTNYGGNCRSFRSNSYESTDAKGISVVREKLMHELKTDLKTATDRMKYAILSEESEEDRETFKSWSMRMKQTKEIKAPTSSSGNAKLNLTSLSRIEIDAADDDGFVDPIASRLRSNITSNKAEKPKFALQLLSKEIHEDFIALLGRGPHKRPTKRPKVVQKELNVSHMSSF